MIYHGTRLKNHLQQIQGVFRVPGPIPKEGTWHHGFSGRCWKISISSSPLNLAVMRKCGYLCHLQENWLLESFRHKDVMRKHQAPNSCLKPERKSSTSTLSPKGCRQPVFWGILDPPMMIHGTWWATSKGSPLSKIRATWRWWPPHFSALFPYKTPIFVTPSSMGKPILGSLWGIPRLWDLFLFYGV